MKRIYLFLTIACIVITHITANAQCECSSCDYVITPSSTKFYLRASDIKAALGVTDLSGIKICIQASSQPYQQNIAFLDLEGSPSDPITITNCGGLVTLDGGTGSALRIWDAKYVRVVGNACPTYKYGIRAKGGGNIVEFKALDGKITDLEAAFLNIGGDAGLTGSAGLKLIDEPGCDQDTIQPRSDPNRWIIRNILLHDNYIHNVVTEGMYIGKGDESYEGKPISCGGATRIASSASIQHVRIYNNIVDYVGWDGIQLKDADLDVKVHNNKISRYGLASKLAQNEGLYLGAGVVGDVYQNEINTGTGNGFQYFGAGNLNFHNNIITNAGEAGIWGLGKYHEVTSPGGYIRIVNNTIVKTGAAPHDRKEGILWREFQQVQNQMLQNNIIVGVPDTVAFVDANPPFDTPINNYTHHDATTVQFVSYAESSESDFLEGNDYHLTASSPAVDAGTNVSGYGADYTKDFDGNARNYNNAYDHGAFEYRGIVEDDSTWAVFINPGGDDFVEGSHTWQRDKQTLPHAYYNTSYVSFTTGSTSTFSGTNGTDAPTEILGSYRYTSGTNNRILKYAIPVVQPGATYQIKLYFARRNTDTFGSGVRRFNILLEGINRYSNYDIYDNAASASDSLHFFVTVHDDVLDLSLEGVGTAHAQVNAIAVSKYAAPPPTGGEQISLALNTGGDTYVEDDVEWQGDKQTTPHAYYDNSYASLTTGSFSTFPGSTELEAPEQVLGSYRYTSGSSNRTLRYNIPVPEPGDYEVKLYFAKKNGDTFSSGARRFNILLEGDIVHTNYDVHDEAGTGATEVPFTVSVTDGSLEIKLVGVSTGHAQINAIRVDGPVQAMAMTALASTKEGAPQENTTPFAVYPNPSNGKVMIQFPVKGTYHVQILDAQNTVAFSDVYHMDAGGSKELDISNLTSRRMYLLKVQSDDESHTFRLVKE